LARPNTFKPLRKSGLVPKPNGLKVLAWPELLKKGPEPLKALTVKSLARPELLKKEPEP